MDLTDLISRLAVALGIGLVIGLERGWRKREAQPGGRTAGIRTFAISGLLGGVVALLAQSISTGEVDGGAKLAGGIVLGLGLAAYAAVIAIFSREENRALGSFSATTAIAGVATFALGAYAVLGNMVIAAGAAIAITALLAAREEIHGWVEKITWPELRSAVVLLAMTFIALPILPDRPIGPFGGVNPREIWLIAIVLASVSFLGYAAVKYFGARRGLLLASMAGGLASSTAVTVTNARRAAAGEGSHRLLVAGVAAASAVMLLRVVAIVAAINPRLLVLVAPSLLVATGAAIGFAAAWMFRQPTDEGGPRGVEFRNPFEFWSVIGFALFLAAIILLGRMMGESFGAAGALAGAAAVGLADVDAVTVSMAGLAPATLSPWQASLAILAAVASNTLAKLGIGAVIGRGVFAMELAVMTLGLIAAGGAAFWVTLALVPG
jgi:uncharacterized membrane protein (DUF4010 family)